MLVDRELFVIAFGNLKNMGLRSLLTLLGIIIGIMAIVALASLGSGLQQAVTSEFESIGLDVIFIEPGGGDFVTMGISRTVRDADIKTIEAIPGVEAVMGFYESSGIATFKRDSQTVFLIGFEPEKAEYLEKTGFLRLKRGRELNPNDKHAILIPEDFALDGFDQEIGLRQKIEINGEEFTVVGILESSDAMMGGFGTINMIWVTKKTMQDVFEVEDPMEIFVKAASKDIVDDLAARIEARLEREHGEKDVTVYTSENLLEAMGAVLGIVQIVLIGLASISLLVGGIGIMNTMLMAVM
ncbi:MAG: ABC transporter permease, partial [Candidatus Diapherotrites archaeon]|nr:ABC transporter permease [Candidatus Diapherotrites archaeon]